MLSELGFGSGSGPGECSSFCRVRAWVPGGRDSFWDRGLGAGDVHN